MIVIGNWVSLPFDACGTGFGTPVLQNMPTEGACLCVLDPLHINGSGFNND